MTDKEIVQAFESGRIPLTSLFRSKSGRWQWYLANPQAGGKWIDSSGMRDAIEHILRQTANESNAVAK